jgi:fimbrial isopeptide formation D2 family protein
VHLDGRPETVMRLLRFLAFLLAAFGFASVAQAQLTFQLRTGDPVTNIQSMPIDSNNCSASGPRAIYVGGLITNGGATTVNNIVATIGGITGNFSLGQGVSQSVGSLGPGQSTGVYWFVRYGCSISTITSTISIASSAAAVSRNVGLSTISSISANAGGNVLSSTLGPGAVVGQTIWFDASYDFGGTDVGDEFILQPSGSQLFDAVCFRLVGTEIRSSNIAPITVGTTNRIYFRQTQKQSGNGYFADVRYYFEYQCAGASTAARPYATMTSGNALKYTGNYDGSGSISISFPGATNPFTIAKSSDITSALAGVAATVKYTVTVTNPSAYASRISQFVDTLPAGAKFLALDAASNVTAANSSSVPAANATGTLTFTGRQDQSYLIAAGGNVKLIYTVQMPSTAGSYANSARATFGAATTPTASAAFTVITPAPLTMAKTSQPTTDPLNGAVNPKLIPGARAAYTVTIANPNAFAATADSILVIDPTPARLSLFVGNISGSSGGPLRFQNGATASGLTYTFTSLASTTDDIDFSSDGGATWTYVPTPDSQGADPLVNRIRVRPKGAMAANSSFSLLFAYVIK